MIWLLTLTLLCQLPLAAQKEVASRWPIHKLTVEGNRHYPTEAILQVAGLKVGQLAGKDEFEEARDRLVATGLFETVGYRFAPDPSSTGFVAVFELAEVDTLYPLRFERLDVDTEKLNAWLREKDPLFTGKIPATGPVVERLKKVLEARLNRPLEADVAVDDAEEFTVVLRPAERLPAVAQVKFVGNQTIDNDTLQNAFAGVAYGVEYTEAGFRRLLDSQVRAMYEAKGRVRVAFTKIETAPAENVDGLLITVTVEEGPVYELDAVRLQGIESEELLKAGGFKTGEPVNFDEVGEGVSRMKKALRTQGYMKNAIDVERSVDDKRKMVALTLKVEPGPRFLFGTLSIEGLDIHGEAAIKKLWTLKAGEPFNADYPDFFLQRVREDGIFDNLGKTRSSLKVDEQSHAVDVTLHF
ncbi:MAG: POTRA domain-containing protein [Bryobacteraceae bacterium]